MIAKGVCASCRSYGEIDEFSGRCRTCHGKPSQRRSHPNKCCNSMSPDKDGICSSCGGTPFRAPPRDARLRPAGYFREDRKNGY